MKEVDLPPDPGTLLESLRDIGYSFGAAIADLVDNSISAEASEIDIWYSARNNDPYIAIVDNGSGMSRDALCAAMKPGSADPRAARKPGDLGRFGLGMKTASFSQCRRMTVVSRINGETSAARWDLDHVARRRAWSLQVLADEEIDELSVISKLGERGTIVLWENLDRVNERLGTKSLDAVLNEMMTAGRQHLELVFHRFLDGEFGGRRLKIAINGIEIDRIDPFATGIAGRRELVEQRFHVNGDVVLVRPFILPFPSKMTGAQHEKLSLGVGFLRSQGFYIYRGGRLLIFGTWFRLLRQSEATKLVRVQVDVPNSLDALWNIDVRKSRAEPPAAVRDWLKVAVENMGEASRRVIRYRGRVSNNDDICHIWNRIEDRGHISYRVNSEHPMISAVADQLSAEGAQDFSETLRAVEESVPLTAIYADMASSPKVLDRDALDPEAIASMLEVFVRALRQSGQSDADIRLIALKSEPFCRYPKIVEDVFTGVAT